jgi:ribose transport system substrate-binding protein
MVEHLQGNPVAKRVDTGVTLVTPKNMDEPQIKQLLEPDLSQWLQ